MLLMETGASCQLLISSAIETTAIAATSWTLLARTGYIDVDGHAIKFSAIQMVDSSLALLVVRHFHETETA